MWILIRSRSPTNRRLGEWILCDPPTGKSCSVFRVRVVRDVSCVRSCVPARRYLGGYSPCGTCVSSSCCCYSSGASRVPCPVSRVPCPVSRVPRPVPRVPRPVFGRVSSPVSRVPRSVVRAPCLVSCVLCPDIAQGAQGGEGQVRRDCVSSRLDQNKKLPSVGLKVLTFCE